MRTHPIVAMLTLVLAGTAHAVIIDFEKFPGPDGKLNTADDIPITAPAFFDVQFQQITTQFAPLGIEFLPNPPVENQNEILSDVTFDRTVGSTPNLLSTNRGEFPFGPIEARFTLPVYEVRMAIGLGLPAFASPNLLEIFDSNSNLLGSVQGTDEFVSLSSVVPIARFRVTATVLENQAAIDDVEFTAVPEPATVASLLFAAGLIGIGCRRHASR
jgi:hypothetical protein